ncbi:phosphopantetheine-containing protein [Mycobacterium sp. djl-10]|nr:phosphopantetheine-containing protein [Mycobacterium sp. djl-10]
MSTDTIIHIFRRVLDTGGVHADSDFFDLGGDSLLATRALIAVARECGAELSYDDFIDNPTPAGVFARVMAVVP